jgi:hypothetical protein
MPPAAPGAPPAGQPGAPGAPPGGWQGGYAPPPYGYGAPPYGYAPPYYYYPPPVSILPPATLPYEEGENIPPGYELKTRPVRSMVIAGSITFGAPYLISLLTGATELAAQGSDGTKFAPMFAPIVGPFITIGTAKSDGAGTLWLVLDGVAQTAGAVMLVYGLVADEKYLKRATQPGTAELLTHPTVMVGPRSAALRWQF